MIDLEPKEASPGDLFKVTKAIVLGVTPIAGEIEIKKGDSLLYFEKTKAFLKGRNRYWFVAPNGKKGWMVCRNSSEFYQIFTKIET